MLMVVQEDPLPSLVQLLPGFVRRLQKQASGPLGFVVVLQPDNPPPKQPARATIKRAFHIFSESMSFGAFAVEKTGFAAAAQRSALNVIMMAARSPFPMKVFGAVDEASRWISGKQAADERMTATELAAKIEEIKAEYHAGRLREAR